MTLKHLRTSSLLDAQMCRVDGRPVQQLLPELTRNLDAKGLSRRLIFAEAIVAFPSASDPGHIAWYVEGETAPVPLTSLPPADREAAQATLYEIVPRLTALAGEPNAAGRALEAALPLRAGDAILWRDGTIVLVEWGLTTTGMGYPPPLQRTPLGSYLVRPADAPPPISTMPTPETRTKDALTLSPLRSSRRPGRQAAVLHLAVFLLFLLLGFGAGLRLLGVKFSLS